MSSINKFLSKQKVSQWICPPLLGFGVVCTAVDKAPKTAPSEIPAIQFASTLQLSLEEPTPQLMQRAQALVIHEFDKGIQSVPSLQDAKMSIQRNGNEVIFSVLTDSDQRDLNEVLMQVIRSIHGQVLARGKYYRSRFTEPPQAEFVVRVHNPRKRTLYINAEQAPLRDLLQEIHQKTRKTKRGFSYIISPECTKRRVDLHFGKPVAKEHPDNLTLKEAMQGIADYLQVQVKEEIPGTYVFVGDCKNSPAPERVFLEGSPGNPFADPGLLNPMAPQVYFPTDEIR